MIDVDLRLHMTDGTRRFDLAARFATDAPFAALYGPSGSGKSLTMQAIAGLVRPAQGHVRIDGRTLYDSAAGIDLPAPARRVGYLFQDFALFPHLSVFDNVAFGLRSAWRRRLSDEDATRVTQLLEDFELSAFARSRPQHLSGGQRQRVALARALACEPQMLLLDEPFAALNPMLRENLRRELSELRRCWAIPALMITHDADDVLELADVAFVYQDGQVVREIDLRTADSKATALYDLVPGQQPDTPWRRKLKKLLV